MAISAKIRKAKSGINLKCSKISDEDRQFYDFDTMQDEQGLDFKVSILGQSFEEAPEVFQVARNRLGSKIAHFGRLENRADYFEVLRSCDVVVSTAFHEFFGVAVIEAAASGCLPILPNRF